MDIILTLIIFLIIYITAAFISGAVFFIKKFTYLFKKMNDCMDMMNREYRNETLTTFEDVCRKYALSSREQEVLRELLKGIQIKEIAIHLCLSIHTIRNHTQRIYKKCNVQNRIELIKIFTMSFPM